MKYTEGWKYIVAETFRVNTHVICSDTAVLRSADTRILAVLIPEGTLTIKSGFAWNGADCFPDTEAILRPSAVHDALLQMLGNGQLCGLEDSHRVKQIKRRIDETLRDMYYENLRKGRKRWLARFYADRVFRAVQKWGTPTGMKRVEVKEAP